MTISENELPKLAAFMAQQAPPLDRYQMAELIGCSGEYVRLLCLPYGDPRRARPSQRMRGKIADATRGAVGLDDWAPTRRVAA